MPKGSYDFDFTLTPKQKRFIFDALTTIITNLGSEVEDFQKQPMRIIGLNPLAGYTKSDLQKAITIRNKMLKASRGKAKLKSGE